MTHREKTIDVLKRELECVKRQDTPECCRDEFGCGACDLVLSPDDVIKAYENAIATMIYFNTLKRRLKHLLQSDFIRSFDEVDVRTKEYKRDIREADVKIMYVCDGKKCKRCSYDICKHTADITHAKNFKYDGYVGYWEETEQPKSKFTLAWERENNLFICPICKSEYTQFSNWCSVCNTELA